jgi:phage/plasmid-like protein (TIGR03299 family)
MAHEIAQMADGRNSIAYVGATPWHGLGQRLTVGADLLTWQQEAGLDWTAERAAVKFDRNAVALDGSTIKIAGESDNHFVFYRSDTGAVLDVHSGRYQAVQPREIIQFYRDLTEKYGFTLETAGALKGGNKIWALARTPMSTALRGNDRMNGYLLLATSYDGTMSTQARFTGVRVVCNNTIEIATRGKANLTVPHSTKFDADAVKLELNIGEAWEKHTKEAEQMTQRIVSKEETVKFFLNVYFGLDTPEKLKEFAANKENDRKVEKFTARITEALFNSPGAQLASARGTLWGALNAVTHDVDFTKPAHSDENRLQSAWFGTGSAIKTRAWEQALKMVA